MNHNLYAPEHTDTWYANNPMTTALCLGAPYTLIRSEFLLQPRESKPFSAIVRNVLITLGGGEPQSQLLQLIVSALLDINAQPLDICVLHDEPEWYMAMYEAGLMSHELKFIGHSKDISQCMQWADIAITAGGSTSWEKLFMGLPSIVFNLFDNQDLIVNWLDKKSMAKVIFSENNALSVDSIKETFINYVQSVKERSNVVEEGPRLVDGRGAQRICDLMNRLTT
ncbi:MAG: UDP-2,4-diacetamido-2,4,6-trideoxy-beta-L-altropyranose hydrolase [Candidatus Omnitrophota bacterium]|jgi:UDP-2,4-diacetamido-2,4,6-trideoxy-beta-L-altropyranose hydrolase